MTFFVSNRIEAAERVEDKGVLRKRYVHVDMISIEESTLKITPRRSLAYSVSVNEDTFFLGHVYVLFIND